MPTYVYECAKCGDEFEVWQSIKDDPLKRHPGSCRGKLAKVIQPAGIVLKGSGFYKNDSGSGAKRAKGTGSSEPKTTESTTSDTAAASSSTSDSSNGSSGASGSSGSGSGSGSGDTSSSSSGNGSTASKRPDKAAKTSSR
jgi:putative FmdB family regulatory protein